MLKAIVSMALLGVLTGCGNMQAADPSVEVDIKGHGDEVDLLADAEVIAGHLHRTPARIDAFGGIL
jgi:hypothetical protein